MTRQPLPGGDASRTAPLAAAGQVASSAPPQAPAGAAREPRRRGERRREDQAEPTLRGAAAGRQLASPVILGCRGVQKSYRKAKVEIPVLRGVDVEINRGQFTAIVGQSGSGKTTLLHVLATLDAPDSGQVFLEGQRIDNVSSRVRDQVRNQRLGMVFQSYHLLPELTALENVLAPLMIRHGAWTWWRRKREFVEQARELLSLVGLSHRQTHRPVEMSGGEMQRAAIARALISRPAVLLADEPTGNLDQETGEGVIKLLRSLNEQQGLTIVMVTHNDAIARSADMILRLHQGRAQRV